MESPLAQDFYVNKAGGEDEIRNTKKRTLNTIRSNARQSHWQIKRQVLVTSPTNSADPTRKWIPWDSED
jgi:hypothetical protein